MKGIIDKNNEVWMENIPKKTYHKICGMARKIGRQDPTFKSITQYEGKNPLRVTNQTYCVRDGYPDFCGQVNRKIPDGIAIHYHDYFFIPLTKKLEKIGIRFEKGTRFQLKKIEI